VNVSKEVWKHHKTEKSVAQLLPEGSCLAHDHRTWRCNKEKCKKVIPVEHCKWPASRRNTRMAYSIGLLQHPERYAHTRKTLIKLGIVGLSFLQAHIFRAAQPSS